MNAPNLLTLTEMAAAVRAGRLGPPDVWKACGSQIARLNPTLNAFITRLDEGLPREAAQLPDGMAARLPLAGAPIAVKDLFDTAGVRTTAGSLFFKDHVPSEDAAAVSRVKDAGGRVIGKTNTHEIALGVTSVNPHFGNCRNPWSTDRVSGGSSGGSAVAVATGMAMAALGTDTGGSIRIPASLCGVVGLKPTFGRVSVRGVLPLSWNLDHVGPLTRCVADAALMLQVLAGYDEGDLCSADMPAEDSFRDLEAGIEGWKIAFATGSYVAECDPEIRQAVEVAAQRFEALGGKITRLDMSFLREAATANRITIQSDAAAFHLERLAANPELFGVDVRKRLETGRDAPLADYIFARRTQMELRHHLHHIFKQYVVVLLPSTPVTAPTIEGADAVELASRLNRFTAPFNLVGLPAISVPCGFSGQGLPLGLQIVGGAWREAEVLQAARAYEREADWSARRPPMI